MKNLKMVGLAAVAAMAFTSIAASSASATALEVEGWGEDEAVTIEASLKSGTSTVIKRTDGSLSNTCTASALASATESPYTGTSVTGAIGLLSFTSCTNTVTVHKAGTLHVEHIASTTNGTVSSSGAEVTVTTSLGFTVSCKTGVGTDIGTLTGQEEGNAEIDINAVLNCGFLLPSANWEGTYLVTSPARLGVVDAVPADVKGHFATPDTGNAVLLGTESETHKLEWSVDGFGGMVCEKSELGDPRELKIRPRILLVIGLPKCHTTNSTENFEIKMNECAIGFAAAEGTKDSTEQTAALACPAKNRVEIMHPKCTIKIPQQALEGLTYTKIVVQKEALTIDFNVKLKQLELKGDGCGAAKNTGSLTGSLTVVAFDTKAAKAVDLTAT